jgi:hypothetical protein
VTDPDEETGQQQTTNTGSDNADSNTSSNSDSSPSESEQDLSIHHRPDASNIDCLAKLDPKFIDTLDPVQKKVIRVGHSLNKFIALHGKVSMKPYLNILNSIHLQIEEFMAPFLIYHKLDVTPQLRH